MGGGANVQELLFNVQRGKEGPRNWASAESSLGEVKALRRSRSHCMGWYQRGIRRAIKLPYRALINTLKLISIPFLLIYGVFDIGYLIFYVKLIFVATPV